MGYNLTPSIDGPSRNKIIRGFRRFLQSISCHSGGSFRSMSPEDSEVEDSSAVIRKLPNNADMLIACSSATGVAIIYRSNCRNRTNVPP